MTRFLLSACLLFLPDAAGLSRPSHRRRAYHAAVLERCLPASLPALALAARSPDPEARRLADSAWRAGFRRLTGKELRTMALPVGAVFARPKQVGYEPVPGTREEWRVEGYEPHWNYVDYPPKVDGWRYLCRKVADRTSYARFSEDQILAGGR